MLDACEERAQPKRIEHRVEYRRRHELRLAEALPVAMPERNHDVPAWFGGDKWLKRLDKRFALAERLAQPPNVVGLAVVELGKRPDFRCYSSGKLERRARRFGGSPPPRNK